MRNILPQISTFKTSSIGADCVHVRYLPHTAVLTKLSQQNLLTSLTDLVDATYHATPTRTIASLNKKYLISPMLLSRGLPTHIAHSKASIRKTLEELVNVSTGQRAKFTISGTRPHRVRRPNSQQARMIAGNNGGTMISQSSLPSYQSSDPAYSYGYPVAVGYVPVSSQQAPSQTLFYGHSFPVSGEYTSPYSQKAPGHTALLSHSYPSPEGYTGTSPQLTPTQTPPSNHRLPLPFSYDAADPQLAATTTTDPRLAQPHSPHPSNSLPFPFGYASADPPPTPTYSMSARLAPPNHPSYSSSQSLPPPPTYTHTPASPYHTPPPHPAPSPYFLAPPASMPVDPHLNARQPPPLEETDQE